MPWPLVFTHYGFSDYLEHTLLKARSSNLNRELIFLGDCQNCQIANSSGWKYFPLRDLKSSKRDQFNGSFYWVQGPKHNPVKGRGDWLRYVSDRFFALEAFMQNNGINNVWHFDSDTMILDDLTLYESRINEQGLDCTLLCNGACPSGYLSLNFLSKYCKSMIEDYADFDFLDLKQKIFNESQPSYAFTEMEAFHRCQNKYDFQSARLCSLFADQNIWFDECICQDHGFDFVNAPNQNKSIKAFYALNGKIFCRSKANVRFRFASINCSWVDTSVFQWIEQYSSSPRGDDIDVYLLDSLTVSVWSRFLDLIAGVIRICFYAFRGIYRSLRRPV